MAREKTLLCEPEFLLHFRAFVKKELE